MPVNPISTVGNGTAFLVAAGLVFELVAAACSSPQTTELNADARAETLMKWVYIGLAGAALFVAVACWIEPKRSAPIIAGGGLAAAFMFGSYRHALAAGLASDEPATESY